MNHEQAYKAQPAKTRQYMRDVARFELCDDRMVEAMERWEMELTANPAREGQKGE